MKQTSRVTGPPARRALLRSCLEVLSVRLALRGGATKVRERHVRKALGLIRDAGANEDLLDAFLEVERAYAFTSHYRHWTVSARRLIEKTVNGTAPGRRIEGVALYVTRLWDTRRAPVLEWVDSRPIGRSSVAPHKGQPHHYALDRLFAAVEAQAGLDSEMIASRSSVSKVAQLLCFPDSTARERILSSAQLMVEPGHGEGASPLAQLDELVGLGAAAREFGLRGRLVSRAAFDALLIVARAVAAGSVRLPSSLPCSCALCGDVGEVEMPPRMDGPSARVRGIVSRAQGASAPPVRPPYPGLLLGWTGSRPASAASRHAPQPLLHADDGHLLTIAPTGTGKGVGAVIPALLTHMGSAVVIDPKGENFHVTADFRRRLGQRVVLLDPFGVTGRNSNRFNPLDVIKEAGDFTVETARMLASLMSIETGSVGRNRWWYDRGHELLTALILLASESSADGVASLATVLEFFGLDQDELTVRARVTGKASPKLAPALQPLCVGSKEARLSGLLVARSLLSGLDDPALREVSDGESHFELSELTRDDPITIYLVIPPDKLRSHRPLLRCWVGVLLTAVQRRRRPPRHPTLFLLDEAGQLGHLSALVTAITLMRGYGLQVWSFWQDLQQLQDLYPSDWPTLLNNCAVHQVFGVSHQFGADRVARLWGLDDPAPLLDPRNSQVLISRRGHWPEIIRRPNYLADPALRQLAGDNPMYAASNNAPDNVSRLQIPARPTPSPRKEERHAPVA